MGDECTCEKCGTNPTRLQESGVWRVGRAEAPAEGLGPSRGEQFLVVGERGIALRQQASENQRH